MAAQPSKKFGVYGPIYSGKSLMITRLVCPEIKMNPKDLETPLFTNCFASTVLDSAGNSYTEHPAESGLDPTEDVRFILVNKAGWERIFEASKVLPGKTILVYTWMDRQGSDRFSAKVRESHFEISSYTGAGFPKLKKYLDEQKNSKKSKRRGGKTSDGWSVV